MHAASLLAALAPRRIVVLRALPLGDLLCAVPALRALRRAAPRAHVALVGLPAAQAFVDRYAELVDELIVLPQAADIALSPAGSAAPSSVEPISSGTGAALTDWLARLRARRFDLAIQMHDSDGPANDLLFEFGARIHAGFTAPGEAARHGCFITVPDHLPEAERCLALTDRLGAMAVDRRLALPLGPHDDADYAALAARHGLEAERLVLIHPGAQAPSRRWPAERFAAVADNLAADGWQIAITGTADEAPLTCAVLGAMVAPALHLAGATSLGSLAALVANARLVVCNDTAISHVAAAMRTASVVIATGSDTRRWAPPDRTRHRVLADYPPCRPCRFDACPHGHACANNVSVEQVVGAACAQLARVPGAHRAAPNVLHARGGVVHAAALHQAA